MLESYFVGLTVKSRVLYHLEKQSCFIWVFVSLGFLCGKYGNSFCTLNVTVNRIKKNSKVLLIQICNFYDFCVLFKKLKILLFCSVHYMTI